MQHRLVQIEQRNDHIFVFGQLRATTPPHPNHQEVRNPAESVPAQHYAPPEPQETTYNTANLCNLVRKWNLRFDGHSDPVAFLERLEDSSEHATFPETKY